MPGGLRREKTLYRRLGLSQSPVPLDQTGLLIIQIDGLSYETLLYALEKGRMPFLRRLLQKRGYIKKPLDSGVPASTPAFQAKLLYGRSDCIPGFRWLDRAEGQVFNLKSTESSAEIERKLQKSTPHLLESGTSICNFFSGGAMDNFFVSSLVGTHLPSTRLTFRDLLVILAVNLGAVFRITFYSLREAVWELLDTLYSVLTRVPRRRLPLFSIVRIMCNAVLSEIGMIATIVEIERNMPAIYLSFLGYDEMAHHDGPLSRQALSALRSIDRRIRQIYRVLNRSALRHYELLILSDHGQLPTIPYRIVAGQEIQETILKEALGEKVTFSSHHTELSVVQTLTLLSYWIVVEPALPRFLRGSFRRLRDWLHRKLLGHISAEVAGDLESLLVLPTSNIAHLYFGASRRKLSTAELIESHRRVFDALVRNPYIEFVLTGDDEAVEICGKKGKVTISDSVRVEGENPLGELSDSERAITQLVELQQMPDSGDIIIFGSHLEDGRFINFLNQLSGHGGVYPSEQEGFLIHHARLSRLLEKTTSPEQLREVLLSIRRPLRRETGQVSAPVPDTAEK